MSKPDRKSSIKIDVDGGDYTGGVDMAVSTRTAALVMQYAIQLHNVEIEKDYAEKGREEKIRQESDSVRQGLDDLLNSPRPKANPTEPTRGKK